MNKKFLLYPVLIIAALAFVIYTFQLKNRVREQEALISPEPVKNQEPAIGRTKFGIPGLEEEFTPFNGTVTLGHDIETPSLGGATGLDGMGKEEIAVFRRQRVSLYPELGIYETDYDPLQSYHRQIYNKITPGAEWLGPVPYYISNPYQLVVLTCANRVTPLNLYCPEVRIDYTNGVFRVVHRGEAALCWFRWVYGAQDYPGQVWPVAVNAWDAGFFYVYADLVWIFKILP